MNKYLYLVLFCCFFFVSCTNIEKYEYQEIIECFVQKEIDSAKIKHEKFYMFSFANQLNATACNKEFYVDGELALFEVIDSLNFIGSKLPIYVVNPNKYFDLSSQIILASGNKINKDRVFFIRPSFEAYLSYGFKYSPHLFVVNKGKIIECLVLDEEKYLPYSRSQL